MWGKRKMGSIAFHLFLGKILRKLKLFNHLPRLYSKGAPRKEVNILREQLTEFLLENQQKFYRYAFTYVHCRETAMDMVQNSFLKAIEQLPTLRNPDAMKTWFYRILTNECLQTLRKCKRESLIEPSDIREEIYLEKAYEPSLELYEAVRKLSPETQTIIYLHYYEERTLKEISQITGSNLNTVKSRLYAGLRKLKELVKEEVQ